MVNKDISVIKIKEEYDDELPHKLESLMDYFSTSPRKVQHQIGKHFNTIYSWMSGRSYPTSLDLIILCHVFDLDPRYFDPYYKMSIEEADLREKRKLAKEREQAVDLLNENFKLNMDLLMVSSEAERQLIKLIRNEDEIYIEKLLNIAQTIRG